MRFLEKPHLSISGIVAEILEGLPDLHECSFAFYGHSMGSIIAFELARALRRAGGPQPSHLFFGAARPPQIGPMSPHLHTLNDDAFVTALQSRYGGIPAEIVNDREALSLFLPALRADFAAYETYAFSPELPLSCPIIGFAGTNDGVASLQDMEGWQEHTSAGFELNSIPGGHFFLEESRNLLLECIRRHLVP
jgi:medium-chain acyl-[acyl-carrier-protein] hydrolase